MIRSDARDLHIRRVGGHAVEERANLPGPATEIVAQESRLFGVGELHDANWLAPSAEAELRRPAGPNIPDPRGDPARRDQVALTTDLEQIDRRCAPFAAAPAADG